MFGRKATSAPQTGPDVIAQALLDNAGTPQERALASLMVGIAKELVSLQRELAETREILAAGAITAREVSPTRGPVARTVCVTSTLPERPCDITSGRNGTDYIAATLGVNERTIRSALESSRAFADLRKIAQDTYGTSLTACEPLVRWLSHEARPGDLRFTLVRSGEPADDVAVYATCEHCEA